MACLAKGKIELPGSKVEQLALIACRWTSRGSEPGFIGYELEQLARQQIQAQEADERAIKTQTENLVEAINRASEGVRLDLVTHLEGEGVSPEMLEQVISALLKFGDAEIGQVQGGPGRRKNRLSWAVASCWKVLNGNCSQRKSSQVIADILGIENSESVRTVIRDLNKPVERVDLGVINILEKAFSPR